MSDQSVRRRRLPLHLPAEGLVFIGGGCGALARATIDALNKGHETGGIAHSTMFVNIVGAFFMAFLVTTWVLRRGQNAVWDRFKLFVGTGFLGAFTTYSTFALAMAQGYRQHLGITLLTGTTVVFAGFLGAIIGAALSRLLYRGGRR
ncbi:MAG: CrcB family protein [Actinomycetaceae bacterium]|nr:CrcB family protein [Actinomycetaceae bacterium]